MKIKKLLMLYNEFDNEQGMFTFIALAISFLAFVGYMISSNCFGACAFFSVLGAASSGSFALFSVYSFYKKKIILKKIMMIVKGENNNGFRRKNTHLQSKAQLIANVNGNDFGRKHRDDKQN